MKTLKEFIRAELFNTRRSIGAHVTHKHGTYDAKDPPVKRVPIRDVRSSWEGGQHFEKAHPDYGSNDEVAHMSKISSALRKGKKVPPIIVRRNPEGLGYQVVDGNHRFQAHRQANKKEIDVQVLPPILAQGKRRKRITGKRKKMYESASPIISVICKTAKKRNKLMSEEHPMLSMDPHTFDQSKEGWRSLPSNQQATVIRDYMRKNVAPGGHFKQGRGDTSVLRWHLGQVQAMQGKKGDAVRNMERSKTDRDPQWDRYVGATTSFLKGDREGFEKNSTGPNYNKSTLERLKKGWGKDYKNAY